MKGCQKSESQTLSTNTDSDLFGFYTEKLGNHDDNDANVTQTVTALPGAATVDCGGKMVNTRPPLHDILIKKNEKKRAQSHKVEPVAGGVNTDTHNFSLESKRESEYVSNYQTADK